LEFGQDGGFAGEGLRESRLAGSCDVVEAAAGALFGCRYLWLFEAALQEACLLKTFERAIEGAVGGETPRLFALFEFPGYGIAMELGLSTESERHSRGEDRDFEGHQCAGFATHGERIRI
jgi:hypothetical protein